MPTRSRFGRAVVRLRWPIALAWVAAAVAATIWLPSLEESQTGALGDLVPNDAAALDAELRSAELFGFPLLSRTIVVQRDPEGLEPSPRPRRSTAPSPSIATCWRTSHASAARFPSSTRAGIVLALSFALLAIVPVRPFRELAFTMSFGLLIDAFLVRTLLAPAVMALVGPVGDWPRTRFRAPRRRRAPAAGTGAGSARPAPGRPRS